MCAQYNSVKMIGRQLKLYICYIITDIILYTTITGAVINYNNEEVAKGDKPPSVGGGGSKVKAKCIDQNQGGVCRLY